jgi:hypothetical protein
MLRFEIGALSRQQMKLEEFRLIEDSAERFGHGLRNRVEAILQNVENGFLQSLRDCSFQELRFKRDLAASKNFVEKG